METLNAELLSSETSSLAAVMSNAMEEPIFDYTSVVQNLHSRTAFLVYLVLVDLVEKSESSDATVIISHAKIAEFIRSSVRTSVRAIRYLKRKGYIEIVDKRYNANRIKVKLISQAGEIFNVEK